MLQLLSQSVRVSLRNRNHRKTVNSLLTITVISIAPQISEISPIHAESSMKRAKKCHRKSIAGHRLTRNISHTLTFDAFDSRLYNRFLHSRDLCLESRCNGMQGANASLQRAVAARHACDEYESSSDRPTDAGAPNGSA